MVSEPSVQFAHGVPEDDKRVCDNVEDQREFGHMRGASSWHHRVESSRQDNGRGRSRQHSRLQRASTQKKTPVRNVKELTSRGPTRAPNEEGDKNPLKKNRFRSSC